MSSNVDTNSTHDEAKNQNSDQTNSQQQSKLSGLKAPSKIVRPSIPVPKASAISATTSISTTNLNTSMLKSTTTLNEETSSETIDFKVNEKCWVNGTKPGTIAFIGETQFKEGVWVGVILDSIGEGKNNGTVNGVTYFKTDEARGVFCRMNKLTRQQVNETTSSSTNVSNIEAAQNVDTDDTIKIGSRVVIQSSDGNAKIGILRYLGTTDFAKGDWAGVELSEKLGKNDGSVAGKRYFQCEPMYGLFAPAGKIQPYQASNQGSNNVKNKLQTTPSSSKLTTPFVTRTGLTGTNSNLGNTSISGSKAKLNKQFSGSQESLVSEKSSIYSTASGVLTNPRKSLAASQQQQQLQKAPNKTPQAASAVTPLSKKPQVVNQPVLLQSLKEKENHIAQLLKERDFERAEFTRAAQKFEQTETKLIDYSKQLEERNEEIINLNKLVASLQENKTNLLTQQANDRTKIEDLEFQIEEHKLGCVDKGDEENNLNASNHDTSTTSVSQEQQQKEEDEILNRLKLQQNINKNHLEEIKFLKEEIDRLNIELKQLRLGEEVYTKEKSDTKKQLDEIENQLKIAKQEADENIQLKEKLKKLEEEIDVRQKSEQALSTKLSEISSLLESSESQKSELEFLYEETNAKLSELTNKCEEKTKEIASLRLNETEKQTDVEFALEEQKVLVQELENKLNLLQAAKNEDLKRFENDLNEFKDANKEQLKNLEEKNNQIQDLEAKLISTQSLKTQELDTLQSEIKILKDGISKTEQDNVIQNKSYTDKLQELESKLSLSQSSQSDQFAQLDNEIKSLKETNIQLQKEKSELEISKNGQICELEREIESLKQKIDNTTNDVSNQNKLFTDKDNELKLAITEHENFRKQKENELDSLKQQLTQLNESFSLQNKQLLDKHQTIEIQYEESKKANIELQTRITELIQNSGNNSAQLISLNDLLKEKEKIIEELQINLNNLHNENNNLKEQKFSIDNRLNDLVKTSQIKESELESKLEKIENLNKELNVQLDNLNDTNSQLNKALLNKETAIKNHELSVNKLENEVNTLIEQINDYKANKTNLEAKLEQATKEINDLGKMLSDQKEKNDENLKNFESNFNGENQKLLAEKNTLIEQLNEYKAKHNDIEIKLNEANKEILDLNTRFKNQKEENDLNLKNIESNISEENKRLIQEKTSLIESNENLNTKLQSLNVQLVENAELLSVEKKEKTIQIEKIVELNKTIADLQADIESQKVILKKVHDEQVVFETEKKALLAEKDKISNELAKINLENENLKNSTASHANLTASAHEELNKQLLEANNKIELLEKQASKDKDDHELAVKSLNELIQDYDAKLELKSSEIDEFKLQYEDEFDRLDTINKALLSELEVLRVAKNELQLQLNKVGSKNHSFNENGQSRDAGSEENSFKILSPNKLKAASVRLFCDICEEFDLHDTEDCPQQSMPQETQLEYESHSKYNAVKAAPRAYCDLCEQFGHEEQDCPNDDKIEEF